MANRSDNFNRANSTTALGTPSDGGSDWVAAAGTWGISSNTGYKVAADVTFQAAYLEASTASADVELTMPTLLNGGPVARLANNSNLLFLQARDSNNDLTLWKIVAGTFTQLGSTYLGAIVDGDVLKLTVNGSNSISAYLNGTLRIGPVTDSAGSANTKHGVMFYEIAAGNNSADTFSITDTAAAAYSPPRTLVRSQAVHRASSR